MTAEAKARLIRAYRAACTAADATRAAVDTVLTPATLVGLRDRPPASQRDTADHLRFLVDIQRNADATCAALATQLRQADARIRAFPTWADHDTPAWRWLLAVIKQESAQFTLI